MALKWRNKLIVAKIEATYGTDAVPTGAANAIRATDVTLSPMEGDSVTRAPVSATLGSAPTIPVGTHVTLTFSVEIAGAGAAGEVPAYGPLLRGCAMAETVTANTQVVYRPVSTGEESVSIYINIDGNRHKLLGARGTVSLEISARQLPLFKFSFVGLWTEPDAAALPTANFGAFTAAVPVGNANSSGFSLHNHAGVMESLMLDLGVDAGQVLAEGFTVARLAGEAEGTE